ncbi:ubiquitin fusion degradation protein UFD1-domain-containing protein [Chytriomyces cf. hyalinus JEL632]|nr:ubiquitin fusion degradation protein UFD1-domain-containing protein [Chytriomyces cf. hyalinus JEL632]
MHQSVLQEILSAAATEPLPNPLSFKIAPLGTSAIAFGAVKEFTASSEDIVQVSQTLAERILASENEQTALATITCVSLPKCEYLKIAPLDPEYLQIPDLRALLESHLRQNFSCISEGDVLIVSSPLKKLNLSKSTAKDFRFLVSESKPEKSCSCIDVDINLDVVPLDVGLAEDAVRQKFFGSQAENSATKDIFLVPEGNVIQAEGNKPWHYTAILTSDAGDCDLLVSVSGNEKPSLEEHDYYNIDEGESRISFSFGGTDAAMDVPQLYIGVRGYTPDAHFKVTITRSASSPPSSGSGLGSASSESDAPLPDHTTCSNCFQQVPQRTLPMHEAFCFRNNAICTRCRTASTSTNPLAYVFKKSEFASHWHCDACATVGNSLLYCATVKEGGSMNPNDAAVVALEALRQSALFKSGSLSTYHLCVPDAKNAKRREVADSLQGMGFHVSWCVKALAESDDDAGKATTWLLQNAPSLSNKK